MHVVDAGLGQLMQALGLCRLLIPSSSALSSVVRISAFQADGPGSIPGERTFWLGSLVKAILGLATHQANQIRASLAQMVERKTLNLVVVGSIPTGGATFTP